MKGKLIQSGFFYCVQFEEDGEIKYIHLLPDANKAGLKDGMNVEFEKVFKLKENATFSSSKGWDVDPVEGVYASIINKVNPWEEIEEEYMQDEYPVFGGPFTDALTPWEWLKKNYVAPLRKDNENS
jgi:hypothetical protein